MKLLILAAGKNTVSLNSNESKPKCLIEIDGISPLGRLAEISKDLNLEPVVIAGEGIDKIKASHPTLECLVNENWDKGTNLDTLLVGLENITTDIIVCYSDVLYEKNIFENLIKSKSDYSIAIDKKVNTNLYENYLEESEKAYLNGDRVTITKSPLKEVLLGEYIGITKLSSNHVEELKKNSHEYISSEEGVLGFLNKLSKKQNPEILDVTGNWKEIDNSTESTKFKFTTKSETLQKLENVLRESIILPQISFKLKEMDDRNLFKEVSEKFQGKTVIVRSSSTSEDTHGQSLAGNFESVLNVDSSKEDEVTNAIKIVKDSYLKNKATPNPEDQIFIQEQLMDTEMSGVLFTRDLETHAPYITINYHIGTETDAVTSGNFNNNTIVVNRSAEKLSVTSQISNLLNSVKEIEKVTGSTSLDIEFAIDGDKIYILQIRPIATYKNRSYLRDEEIAEEIKEIKNFLKEYGERDILDGKLSAYGVMPDWNPAEIVGVNPRPLSFSLYRNLITDDIWNQSRIAAGYKSTDGAPGIISLGGKPYVDVKMSFNSLTPKEVPSDITEKLIDSYISKLRENPEFHDKIEFEIVHNVYNFAFNKEALVDVLSKEEIEVFSDCLKNLTENIIISGASRIDKYCTDLELLNTERKRILSLNCSPLIKSKMLLDSCRRYGTLPFSVLARFSFVASSFLKSMLDIELISSDDYDKFFNSISTVSDSYVRDLDKAISGSLSVEEFGKKYGHLRPGTYDITSKRYLDVLDSIIKTSKSTGQEKSHSHFELTVDQREKISKKIEEIGFSFDIDTLFDFMKKAIELRESSKFEFTKNLSEVLENIKSWGEIYDLTEDDISYLHINDLLSLIGEANSRSFKSELTSLITFRKTRHLLTKTLKMPELIFDENDVDSYSVAKSKPNFISQKSIVGEIKKVTSMTDDSLENKIVVIENADPGYDWIFAKNIAGLVTKYGGAASHMAIRCAEFDLPAVIGCGAHIYDSLEDKKTVSLDCSNKKVELF